MAWHKQRRWRKTDLCRTQTKGCSMMRERFLTLGAGPAGSSGFEESNPGSCLCSSLCTLKLIDKEKDSVNIDWTPNSNKKVVEHLNRHHHLLASWFKWISLSGMHDGMQAEIVSNFFCCCSAASINFYDHNAQISYWMSLFFCTCYCKNFLQQIQVCAPVHSICSNNLLLKLLATDIFVACFLSTT